MTIVDYQRRSQTCGCTSPCGCDSDAGCALHGNAAARGLERTRYYPRQIVTPDDLTQDQMYFGDKLRRHNRLLHGWGIVCGLVVSPCEPREGEEGQMCKVKVSSGYALDPYGNELVLPSDQVLDLCKEDVNGAVACVPQSDPWCRPVDSARQPGPMHLAVRHVERSEKPVHAPNGCSCRETNCENTRIKDALEFKLLPEKPDHYDEACEPAGMRHFCQYVDECPSCPSSGWIVLAMVHMAGSSIEALDEQACRRHVYSFSRFCIDCSDEAWHREDIVRGPVRKYVGTATGQPDAVIKVHAIVDGEPAEIAVAVSEADIADKTAVEVKELLDSVLLLDVDDSKAPPFTAGLLISHSPVEADWKFEGVDDLELRLRTPAFAPMQYENTINEVTRLLDRDGRNEFAYVLENPARLDEFDIETINGVGASAGRALRNAGVAKLGDLHTVDVAHLPDVSEQIRQTLLEVREALEERGRPTRGR